MWIGRNDIPSKQPTALASERLLRWQRALRSYSKGSIDEVITKLDPSASRRICPLEFQVVRSTPHARQAKIKIVASLVERNVSKGDGQRIKPPPPKRLMMYGGIPEEEPPSASRA